MLITRTEFRQRFVQSLVPLYDQREAQALFRRYVEERLGVEYYLFLLDMDVPADLPDGWETELERLASGEPFQYVMGQTEFCGLPFKVTPSTGGLDVARSITLAAFFAFSFIASSMPCHSWEE